MSRVRIVYSHVTGKRIAEFHGGDLVYAADEYYAPEPSDGAAMIMPDIAPYQSMITGEMITSRSRHRAHLREHGCVEVGNEQRYLQKPKEVAISRDSARRRTELVAALVDKHYRRK